MKGEEGEEGEEEEEQLSSSSDTWFCLLCGYHRRVFVAFLKNSFQLFLLFGFFFLLTGSILKNDMQQMSPWACVKFHMWAAAWVSRTRSAGESGPIRY